AAQRAGVATPRSQPRARQQASRPRQRGPGGGRARARGRRTRPRSYGHPPEPRAVFPTPTRVRFGVRRRSGAGRGSYLRTLPNQRSAWAFAFGAWIGVRMVSMTSLPKMASKSRLNFRSRSWIKSGATARLVTHPGGYALEVDSEQLDLTR